MKTKILSILFLILLSSCGSESTSVSSNLNSKDTRSICPWQKPEDLLLSSAENLLGELKNFSSAELKEDLTCLSEAISKSYVANHYYESMGYSLKQNLDGLISQISDPANQEWLLDQLLPLHEKAYDVHLSYRLKYGENTLMKRLPSYKIYYVPLRFKKEDSFFISEPTDDFPTALTIVGCDQLSPMESLAENGKDIYYSFVGQFLDKTTLAEAKCQTVDSAISLPIIPKPLDNLSNEDGKFHFQVMDNGILYVRLPRMTPGVSDEQQKLLDFIDKSSLDYPIIFDLRKNSGGDDSYAYELALHLRSKEQKLPKLKWTDLNSLYSVASTVNYEFMLWKSYEAQGNQENAQLYKKEYDEYLNGYQNLVTEGHTINDLEITSEEIPEMMGLREKPYTAPIVLLVDKGCASSCESMIEVFDTLANTKILGSHSFGALHFGNVGLRVLPHTKIQVFFGWRAFEYDTNVLEGVGYNPNYYIFSENSLDVAIKYLQNRRL